MGPSSGRDITSPAMSMATNPLTYIASVVTIPVGFLKAVNSRANLLDATRMRDQAALDPYTFVREAWRQKEITIFLMATHQQKMIILTKFSTANQILEYSKYTNALTQPAG